MADEQSRIVASRPAPMTSDVGVETSVLWNETREIESRHISPIGSSMRTLTAVKLSCMPALATCPGETLTGRVGRVDALSANMFLLACVFMLSISAE